MALAGHPLTSLLVFDQTGDGSLVGSLVPIFSSFTMPLARGREKPRFVVVKGESVRQMVPAGILGVECPWSALSGGLESFLSLLAGVGASMPFAGSGRGGCLHRMRRAGLIGWSLASAAAVAALVTSCRFLKCQFGRNSLRLPL